MVVVRTQGKQRGFCLDMVKQGDKLKAALGTGSCAALSSTFLSREFFKILIIKSRDCIF